jgi:hypothetical protein
VLLAEREDFGPDLKNDVTVTAPGAVIIPIAIFK